jgi:lipopolysaccharide biosynthesis regulator YciM
LGEKSVSYKKEPELYPPGSALPVRSQSRDVSRTQGVALNPLQAAGVVQTEVVGWRQRRRARALQSANDALQAHKQYMNSIAELERSYINLEQVRGRLADLPSILAHDRAMRRAQRLLELCEKQEAAQAAKMKLLSRMRTKEDQLQLDETIVKARLAALEPPPSEESDEVEEGIVDIEAYLQKVSDQLTTEMQRKAGIGETAIHEIAARN